LNWKKTSAKIIFVEKNEGIQGLGKVKKIEN